MKQSIQAFNEALDSQLSIWKFWHDPRAKVYVEEERTAMLHRDGYAPSLADMISSEIHTVGQAEPYYVSSDVCDLLEQSLPSLPDTPIGNLTIPGIAGWVYFASPRDINSPDGDFLYGFTWHQEEITKANDGPTDQLNSLGICFYGIRKTGQLLVVVPISRLDWPLHDNWGSSWSAKNWSGSEYSDAMEYLRKYVSSFFAFISQRLSVVTPTKAARSTMRRMQRQGITHDSIIQIVTLRSRDYQREGYGREVNWACRWLVRAHWRNQYYPSRELHIPKLIPAYIKGPSDKPLKRTGLKLFAVVR